MNNYNIEQLIHNFSLIIAKYFDIYNKLINKKQLNQYTSDPLQISKIFLKVINNIMSNPEKIIQYQMNFFQRQFETLENIISKYNTGNSESTTSKFKDRRFKDSLWEEHCTFAWIKESYFTFSNWIDEIVKDMPSSDFSELELRRLNFVIKQFLDAIAPTNFPNTNPEVIRIFFETSGENFLKGLDNLLKDIENSKNGFQISNCDLSKFKVGENIAFTEGHVVYKNKIIELIHYEPKTEKQYSIPLLIVPPFINKYYILDLQAENSMVKWLLEQGYNVFIISWVNPDESLADENFSDYMVNGPLAAIDYLTKTLKFKEVNCSGYCIGGTLLATTIAYLKSLNDSRIKTATFFTTLLDFNNAGDLSIFVDEYFINEVENYMKSIGGFLDGGDLELTFNLLRSNDMIWPHYINNYLLGKESFPFDLLYWNSDSTRLPMQLHLYYLKNMYKDNLLKEAGALKINEIAIDINKVDIPSFVVAAYLDHIVPWQNALNSAKLFSGNTEFILADSGHIAGIINHPSKNKYSFWQNNKKITHFEKAEDWLNNSTSKPGSWWFYWDKWLQEHSGELSDSGNPKIINPIIIDQAPGAYVRMKY